jgi:hypothetical protein
MTIYPQRANNLLERFFRQQKRDHRRKTGNSSMNRLLQTLADLADAGRQPVR